MKKQKGKLEGCKRKRNWKASTRKYRRKEELNKIKIRNANL
jgi:hypothetical protein